MMPCKHCRNIKARKNGNAVSFGVVSLFCEYYCYESIKGEHLSLEIGIAALQHGWIRCIAFSQDDAVQDQFLLQHIYQYVDSFWL